MKNVGYVYTAVVHILVIHAHSIHAFFSNPPCTEMENYAYNSLGTIFAQVFCIPILQAWYDVLCLKLQHLCLLTYLPTPRCRVPLEQLTGLQLVKKFPAFHGTRRFITALTSVRHLSLSWASPIQSI